MKKAVVIGAGFGGIAAALRLRAAGLDVQVFDNQAMAGGRATVYKRDGYTFDAGPTVITAPFLFEELFALFDRKLQDYCIFQELHPWYRIRFADGRSFDYGGSTEQLIEAVNRFAPEDTAGYRKLLGAVERIYKVGFERLADIPFDRFLDMVRVLPEMAVLRSDRSVYQFVSLFLKNERLRRVFSFQPLLVGGNPFSTTSIYSLIQHLERTAGVHFCMGGTGALVDALVKLTQEQKIDLRLNTRVEQILIEEGRARGVLLAGGERIAADVVIANADAPALYKKLVPARWRKTWTDRRIESRKYSMGLFVLYLGVRKQYPHLAHHTILLGQEYKKLLESIFDRQELSNDISLYLHAPTRTDPGMAPPDCENLYALVPVPNLQAGIDWKEKGAALEKLTLDVLERTECPGLRDALEVSFYVTPEHFSTHLLTHHGTGFSIQPTLLQSAWFRFHNRSEDVAGLYLVGAGTHPGAGLPGVLCSAKVLESYIPEMLEENGLTAANIPYASRESQKPADLMARAGKTFYRAAQLLPATFRGPVTELYAFCRRVDDMADESTESFGIRFNHLLRLEQSIRGEVLSDVASEMGLTASLALQLGDTLPAAATLVHAARQDMLAQQPADSEGLTEYAFGVAGTVGLMLCQLLGAKQEGRLAGVHLGIAMQLSNIARDVAEDLREGRVYLPASFIDRCGVERALQLQTTIDQQQLVQVTGRLLALAESHYTQAYQGIWTLPWRIRWSILAAAMCYRQIGIEVGRNIPRSWKRRTSVSSGRKLFLIGLAALRLIQPRFWRARVHTSSPDPGCVPSRCLASLGQTAS